jgi:hypothetical protein
MRTHPAVLVLALFLLAPSVAIAPPGPGGNDTVLARLHPLLRTGPGWTMTLLPGSLILERSAPVWVLDGNRINAPVSLESAAARTARIRRHGRQVKPRLVFRLEPRWTTAQVAAARRTNEGVAKLLEALPAKHGVAHRVAAARARKPGLGLGGTPAEQGRVAAYEAERKSLVARLVKLPEHHSQQYSLFFDRHEGWDDAFHLVDPPDAATECYRFEQQVRAALLPL